MAKEKWTVFYQLRNAGSQQAVNYKEKEMIVKGKEKSEGLGETFTRESNHTQSTSSPFITNEVNQALFVTVIAEGAEEACLAVTKYIGEGIAGQKAIACLSANITETVSQ